MKIVHVVLSTICLLMISGCATTIKQVDREVGVGQSPEYKQGYGAGCNSGYVAAGNHYYKFTKDVTAYSANQVYKQGWDDGFTVCKGKYDSLGH